MELPSKVLKNEVVAKMGASACHRLDFQDFRRGSRAAASFLRTGEKNVRPYVQRHTKPRTTSQ